MEIKNKGKENEYKIVTSFKDIEENGLDKKYYLVINPKYNDKGLYPLKPRVIEGVCPYERDVNNIGFLTKGIKNEPEYLFRIFKKRILNKRSKFAYVTYVDRDDYNVLEICTSLEDAMKSCVDLCKFNNNLYAKKLDNYKSKLNLTIKKQKDLEDSFITSKCTEEEFNSMNLEIEKELDRYDYIISNFENTPTEFKIHKMSDVYKYVSDVIIIRLKECDLCITQNTHVHGSTVTYSLKGIENCKLNITPVTDDECDVEFEYGNGDIYKLLHFNFTYENHMKLLHLVDFMKVRYRLEYRIPECK